jgi:hypothetical protein
VRLLAKLQKYSSFAWELRKFLREPLTLEKAKAIIRQRMEQRDANFLRLLQHGIFGYPKSPYLPLLKLAHCDFSDIETMVRSHGLEQTLHALRTAGVYITFEEFKGREPIVRQGKTIPVKAEDFDNPHLSHYYQIESSGTTGPATRVSIDLDHLAAQAPQIMVVYDAHDVLDVPTVLWRNPHDSIGHMLRAARFERPPEKWLSPLLEQYLKRGLPRKHHITTYSIIVLARWFGASIPWPRLMPLNQAIRVARWVKDTLKAHGACLIRGPVSLALRVCLAARQEGWDLRGATFMGGGEPPTPAKVRGITHIGARWVPHYGFVEAGHVSMGCARPVDGTDTHVLMDSFALIAHPRQMPGSEIPVDAFHFTTLLPTARKLLLNVEMDDHGILERRSCGCPLESYGFTEHLRQIYSSRKLTGEGVSLIGTDMIRILQEVLPARFGGSPLDYQLLEEEDEQGFTRLSLLVSPKLEIADENAIIEAVWTALGHDHLGNDLAQALWRQAQMLQVKRMEPIWTARGKLMPLYSMLAAPVRSHKSRKSTHKEREGESHVST